MITKTFEVKILPKSSPNHNHKDFHIGIRGFGYVGDKGTIGLIRCPACKRENHSMNVPSGTCSWCGFDANPVVKEALDDSD
jgi:ribosomal protein L37E